MTICTFGHSTLPIDDAVSILTSNYVDTLIDVRSHPNSKWPQHRQVEMQQWLAANGIEYEWWPQLGGWDARHAQDSELRQRMAAIGVDLAAYSKGAFPKGHIAKTSSSRAGTTWTSVGLYDYSWFMTLPEFICGARAVLQRGKAENLALCCAEAVPWKCHRSMICDWLIGAGCDANHLLGRRSFPHSKMLGNRLDRYDPRIIQEFKDASV